MQKKSDLTVQKFMIQGKQKEKYPSQKAKWKKDTKGCFTKKNSSRNQRKSTGEKEEIG